MHENKSKREPGFQLVDLAHHIVHPYKQSLFYMKRDLNSRIILYGPCKINKRIGKVSCDLGLPKEGKEYITFYVSYFMEITMHQVTISKDLLPTNEGNMVYDSERILQMWRS